KDPNGQLKTRFFALLDRLESGGEIARTDVIDRFARDQTLDELVASIERDIGANRPAAALDRLHTYCMKKFAHLLDARGVAWERAEPLHSRVGKYVKALGQDRELRDVTTQIIKNAIGVFDKFNHVRNNRSLAHDNELLEPFPFRLNRNGALDSCFDAPSSREPVSTSLENALDQAEARFIYDSVTAILRFVKSIE